MSFLKKFLLLGVVFLWEIQVTWSMNDLPIGGGDSEESCIKTPSKPKITDKKTDKRAPRKESKKTTQKPEASSSSREVTRLRKKLEHTHVSSPSSSVPVTWDSSRVFTPNSLIALDQHDGLQLCNLDPDDDTSVILYKKQSDSQALIRADDRTIGGSVTSTIHTEIARKKEKKSTFIQYDKERVDNTSKDFTVKAKNYRGWVNYQGGHIIDHKYSAGNSHNEEINYIPVHYFYNAPLKEYLVQRSDAYIEIPLFTPNPPRIGVKGDGESFHDIPIGIIFIQIKNKKIEGAYFFPNNYDYKALKEKMKLKKDLAANITPYFKLKLAFHQLLQPACIVDIQQDQRRILEQVSHEGTIFSLMDDISYGMSLAECSHDEEIISKVSFEIVQRNKACVRHFLKMDNKGFKMIKQPELGDAFNQLGRFLVQYALRNAVKTEVLSVNSRLIFLNVMIDFLDAYTEVKEEALEFVNTMSDSFKRSLCELQKIASTMGQEELLYLANTYQRLADPSIHDFSQQGYDDLYAYHDLFVYSNSLIDILIILTNSVESKPLGESSLFNLVDLHNNAQNSMAYLLTLGYPREELESPLQYLREKKPKVVEWFEAYKGPSRTGGLFESYAASIGRTTDVRSSLGWVRACIEYLGTSSSAFYGSDSEEENEEQSDSSDDEKLISS
jgi:hypothetical protein